MENWQSPDQYEDQLDALFVDRLRETLGDEGARDTLREVREEEDRRAAAEGGAAAELTWDLANSIYGFIRLAEDSTP